MLEQPVRVLAEAAVIGPAGRLDVGDVPVCGPQDAQQGFRMGGAGADFDVERLLQEAAIGGPELRELEDKVLEGQSLLTVANRQSSIAGVQRPPRRISRSTRGDRRSRSRCL